MSDAAGAREDEIARLTMECDRLRRALAVAQELDAMRAARAPEADAGEAIAKHARVALVYTNWRGITTVRRILPFYLWYGATEHHAEQWLVRALDLDKGQVRDFALVGFKGDKL